MRYRGVLLDLDGVLYRGDEALPGAREAVAKLRAEGVRVAFVTNNSARTPAQVAAKLTGLGFEAAPEEVVTSAMAVGELLEVTPGRTGRTAFVIGEDGVREALESFGVEILDGDPEAADLVVVGWDRSADYAKLKRAGLLVQRGAKLIATNPDGSYPAPDGLWPGAGALLAAIVATTGAEPAIAGKPRPALFEVAGRALGEGPFLVVGDRLETDIEGAAAMGWDSALVLTGVASPADLLRTRHVPRYLLRALPDLLEDPARAEPASAEDLPTIRALLDGANLFADVEERLHDLAVARAEDAGVVGVAGLEVHGTDALLRSVAVSPERQGRSIGTLLTAVQVARARQAGASAVWLLTETAEAFFASLRFARVERSAVPASLEALPAVAGCATERAVAMRLAL